LRQLFLATGGRKRPILLKKSRHNFGPRKSVVDVEIWFAQKTELSWFLRSNAKIQRFLIYRKAALSEADFFNKIGQKQWDGLPLASASECQTEGANHS